MGLLLAGLYGWIHIKLWGTPKHDSFAEMAFILQLCILFIASIYNTGWIGYRLFKNSQESDAIKQYSKQHLLLLNGFGLALFILGFFLN